VPAVSATRRTAGAVNRAEALSFPDDQLFNNATLSQNDLGAFDYVYSSNGLAQSSANTDLHS